MTRCTLFFRFLFFWMILCSFVIVYGQAITGTASMKLHSAATPQLKAKQLGAASDSLSRALHYWINDFFGNTFDPQNVISKHFLKKFTNYCLPKAKEKSYIKGRMWFVELTIPNTIFDSLIAAYNTHYDSLAYYTWENALKAQKEKDYTNVYTEGLQALSYSMAHIGMSLATPGHPDKPFTQHVQNILQSLIDSIVIEVNTPIIEGKPPYEIKNTVSLSVTCHSIPLSNIPLIGVLNSGRKIISIKTDPEGKCSLKNLKIPFVPHGEMLHIQPDFSILMEISESVDAKALGLILSENTDQTLMFKISKPIYSLEYRANSVNKIQIPSTFLSNTFIHSFLIDSCSLQPIKEKTSADIALIINCQIVSYTHDDIEQTRLKVEADISVKDFGPKRSNAHISELCYEQYYDYNITIPIGLFFWDSSNHLRILIRKALDKL